MRLNRSASCSILVLLLEISLTEATIEAIPHQLQVLNLTNQLQNIHITHLVKLLKQLLLQAIRH